TRAALSPALRPRPPARPGPPLHPRRLPAPALPLSPKAPPQKKTTCRFEGRGQGGRLHFQLGTISHPAPPVCSLTLERRHHLLGTCAERLLLKGSRTSWSSWLPPRGVPAGCTSRAAPPHCSWAFGNRR